MRRSLPPLSALRAFEAVARRLSFSKAAEELHVTPGAISQQIRSLEELLGATLFVRNRRSVALTDFAGRMLPEVQAGLELLWRAVGGRTTSATGTTLTISVTPSFASKWLMPKLQDFSDHYPDIDLRIAATTAFADFRGERVDLAIRLGRGHYPDLHVEPLFAEGVVPLCSPKLLKRKLPLKRPDDLKMHRLIHDSSIPDAWERWLALAGASQVSAHRGPRFSLAELAMQAAIEGTGVVLGRMLLAEGDLAAGRLVQPFKAVLPLDVSWALVMPRGNIRRYEVRCFRNWLYTRLKAPGRLRKSN
jgi:LysR family glycine cleavage system transcriptional activator